MKVLLHICCAPCTIYPLRVLKAQGHEVTGFFYNPNIHPYTEFERRRETLVTFAAVSLLPLVIDDTYDHEGFLKGALSLGKDRCLACYRMRLERAFQKVGEVGAEGLTTTLLYSKYQRHEDIAQIGDELSQKFSIPFLYRDFRTLWRQGQTDAVTLGLYKQQYCGCVISEQERFKKSR
jgi:epoxyqueuosine reductase